MGCLQSIGWRITSFGLAFCTKILPGKLRKIATVDWSSFLHDWMGSESNNNHSNNFLMLIVVSSPLFQQQRADANTLIPPSPRHRATALPPPPVDKIFSIDKRRQTTGDSRGRSIDGWRGWRRGNGIHFGGWGESEEWQRRWRSPLSRRRSRRRCGRRSGIGWPPLCLSGMTSLQGQTLTNKHADWWGESTNNKISKIVDLWHTYYIRILYIIRVILKEIV